MVANTRMAGLTVTRPYINEDGELVNAPRLMSTIVEDTGSSTLHRLLGAILLYGIRNDRLIKAKLPIEVTQNIANLSEGGTHEFTDPVEALNITVTQYPTNGDRYGVPFTPSYQYRLGKIAPMFGQYIGDPVYLAFEKQRLTVPEGCTGIWYSLYPGVIMDVSVLSSVNTVVVQTDLFGSVETILG